MHDIDLEKSQREETRWRILRALDAGRPLAVSETVLWRTLTDIDLPVTPHGVRRELTYLQDLGLVNVLGKEGPTWRADLTAKGVDVIEYTIDAPPGVDRPRKWW